VVVETFFVIAPQRGDLFQDQGHPVSMMLARLSIRHKAPTPAMIAAVASGVKNGSTGAAELPSHYGK
jgi:hypothetical protein